MERMTHIDNKGWYVGDQSFPFDERRRGEVVDRLAAYEDTGLEPKQARIISNVLREVGETYNCWFDYVVNCVLENSHLKDLAQAEKDGRLVVLPSNDPLTLSELREMDGDPVYDGLAFQWFVIDSVDDIDELLTEITMTDGTVFDTDEDGVDCALERFYRHKPKEGTI